MTFSTPTHQDDLSFFRKNWVWFFLWGIALEVLGLFAISAATLTTLISVIVIGCLLILGGIVVIIDSVSFWWGRRKGFFLHILMGVLYLIAGILLFQDPLLASISITLLLGIFYIVLGIVRLIFSMSYRLPKWGFGFLNGLIALLLGILILAHWPASSLVIIGLFVGIDLLFCGFAYMMAALAAKNTTIK